MTGPTRSERYARAVVRRLVSRRFGHRGRVTQDSTCTLLVVDYRGTRDTARLVGSFRKFVSATAPVIVVQNTTSGTREFRALKARTVGPWINIHHGLGLDWGLRFARTEYVLICDPDSVILAAEFWPRMKELVDRFGVASIDNGAAQYHPICLAFRLGLWKEEPISMEENWSRDYDVAGALTELLGFDEAALLQRTRGAGPPLPSRRPGHFHHLGEVYEDLFSNTYGASRVLEMETGTLEGWSRDDILDYHRQWRAWADDVLTDDATAADFPLL